MKATPDNASAHNNLGTALGKQSKFREATLEFAQAAKLQPDYLEAHYNLANAYMLQSRIDEAIGEFNIVLRLNPGFESARRGLAFAQRKKAGAAPSGPGGLISAPDAPKK